MVPRVSVVLCVYNGERYLAEALDSVKAQTFTDFEAIVVNDGSTDSSPRIAERYREDQRFRVITNETNRGLAYSRRAGVSDSRGEWVAFIDSDDIWLPDKLEKQLAVADADGRISLVFSNGIEFDETGDLRPFYKENKFPSGDLFARLLESNCLWASSVMVRRRDALVREGRDLDYCDDYLLWNLALSRGGIGVGVREPLVRYRKHASNMSQARSRAFKHVEIAHRRLLELELAPKYVRILRRSIRRDLSDQIVADARAVLASGQEASRRIVWRAFVRLVGGWAAYPRRVKPLLMALDLLPPGGRRRVCHRLARRW